MLPASVEIPNTAQLFFPRPKNRCCDLAMQLHTIKCLVGRLVYIFSYFPYIGNVIITDEVHHFSEGGVSQPPSLWVSHCRLD